MRNGTSKNVFADLMAYAPTFGNGLLRFAIAHLPP